MKILILTQYFYPETGAPQNRLFSLASNLKKYTQDIEVLTAMPNYPKMEIFKGYKGKWYCKEEMENITIHRAPIYVSKSKKIFSRLLNYFSFVFSSLWIGLRKVKSTDVIICESPPLFLGISAYILSRVKGAKLVFNVSDLWPESAEKLDLISNKTALKLTYGLEKWLYKVSHLVTGQTQGIVKNINARFPEMDAYWFRNGIDLNQFNTDAKRDIFSEKYSLTENDFVLLYAGILGYAQGLEIIIHAADNLKRKPTIKFVIIGDGPEHGKLVKLQQDLKLTNVIFTGNIDRKEIPSAIASSSAYIVPLKKSDLFLGAIPSKLFEPLIMKVPIILGVDGEARELFINQGNAGLYYEPENCEELIKCINDLYDNNELRQRLGSNGHNYVKQKFDRDEISKEFWDILNKRLTQQ